MKLTAFPLGFVDCVYSVILKYCVFCSWTVVDQLELY